MDVIKDFHFGQLEDGSIQLAILYTDKTHRVGIMAPEMIAQMLATLMQLVPQAKDPNLRRHAQLLSIREVSGLVEHGVATLSYELEGGAHLQTTLPADSARALSQALAKANADPTSH